MYMMKPDKEVVTTAALNFLYKKGYITEEEIIHRKSERLNEVSVLDPSFIPSTFVTLIFENGEWVLEAEVDNMLNVVNVEYKDHGHYWTST